MQPHLGQISYLVPVHCWKPCSVLYEVVILWKAGLIMPRRRPLMNSSVIIWYLPPTVRDLQYLVVNLNFLWNNFSLSSFSHKLIFSFNPETVNVVYKIENIKGPACVQRQAFLLDFQPSQETSLSKSLVESAWEGGGCPQLLSRDHLWLFFGPHGLLKWANELILVVGWFDCLHQTEHLSLGFILEPGLQL